MGAELLLTMVQDLTDAQQLPPLPVLLDSPAGLTGVEVHRRALAERWHELHHDGRVGVPDRLVE
ncbi:hypothetical protein, partial [Amycolatopsis sp.]|uniref:hypothetical protein n=1 Tax=Amycolatopsis sp. TaxID=37632 RepID=UPI002D870850|nr:hypothetical protein [Amycolatopsis sp.]